MRKVLHVELMHPLRKGYSATTSGVALSDAKHVASMGGCAADAKNVVVVASASMVRSAPGARSVVVVTCASMGGYAAGAGTVTAVASASMGNARAQSVVLATENLETSNRFMPQLWRMRPRKVNASCTLSVCPAYQPFRLTCRPMRTTTTARRLAWEQTRTSAMRCAEHSRQGVGLRYNDADTRSHPRVGGPDAAAFCGC